MREREGGEGGRLLPRPSTSLFMVSRSSASRKEGRKEGIERRDREGEREHPSRNDLDPVKKEVEEVGMGWGEGVRAMLVPLLRARPLNLKDA